MLEGLHLIDWNEQGFPALPTWIRGLASYDEATRRDSYNNFYDSHLLGESIGWKVTPLIIPFLIELLTYEEVEDKPGIILILMQLASATHAGLRTENPLPIYYETHNELTKGFSVYENFLKNADPEVRHDVSNLLNYLK